MIAQLVNFNGAQAAMLAARPNWDTPIKLTLDLPSDVEKQAITFLESRRNFAKSARYTFEWRCYLSNAADATELRILLTRLRGESVIVPLWTDVCELQNPITQGQSSWTLYDIPARGGVTWVITDETFTTWEFITVQSLNYTTQVMQATAGVSRAYPAGTFLYPLIIGRLEERPKPEAITDETFEADFKLKESSEFALRLGPASTGVASYVGGRIPQFQALPKWTTTPNHSRPLDWTEMPDIVYQTVGFLREDQQRVYDHRNARGQELEFYQSDRASVAQIERFYRDRRATTLPFMISTYRGDLRLLYNTPVPGHPTWIQCEHSEFTDPGREAQPGDPFIAMIGPDDVVYPYQLSNTIDSPPNQSILVVANVASVDTHHVSNTIVTHLLLARFAESKLQWTYDTPYLATTRIKFQELPHEYASLPVPLPEPAYLFIFRESGVRTDMFTSYENTITISDNGAYRGTYVPAPFSFQTVKVGIKLDQEKLEVKSFKFDGNPLNRLWPFALDGVLRLTIAEVDANNPLSSTAQLRFWGDVWSVDSDYKATIIPFGNLFDRKFPRFLLSVSDNYVQFSPPTKITASAFQVAGQIHGAVNHTSQTLLVTSVAGHAKVTDYFAGGWLDTGSGVNIEHRGILHSIAASGNDVTLTIDRPLLKAVANQPLTMYPGYDGSIDQCDTVFNNRINFGGQPFIPDVNPGVKAMKPKQTAGGKKGS